MRFGTDEPSLSPPKPIIPPPVQAQDPRLLPSSRGPLGYGDARYPQTEHRQPSAESYDGRKAHYSREELELELDEYTRALADQRDSQPMQLPTTHLPAPEHQGVIKVPQQPPPRVVQLPPTATPVFAYGQSRSKSGCSSCSSCSSCFVCSNAPALGLALVVAFLLILIVLWVQNSRAHKELFQFMLASNARR